MQFLDVSSLICTCIWKMWICISFLKMWHSEKEQNAYSCYVVQAVVLSKNLSILHLKLLESETRSVYTDKLFGSIAGFIIMEPMIEHKMKEFHFWNSHWNLCTWTYFFSSSLTTLAHWNLSEFVSLATKLLPASSYVVLSKHFQNLESWCGNFQGRATNLWIFLAYKVAPCRKWCFWNSESNLPIRNSFR